MDARVFVASQWQLMWWRFRKHKVALASAVVVIGFYTIVLSVPAHTTIPAHSHRDERVATVVSGTWQFGYGDRFAEQALKSLPPGSVYSEPGGANHFARTGAEPVLVEISGVGPTDTRYVNPADAPH